MDKPRSLHIMERISHSNIPWVLAIISVLTVLLRNAKYTGWDVAFYTSPMFSIFRDGDLLLQNNLIHTHNLIQYKIRLISYITPRGEICNMFSIGPSLIFSFFLHPLIRLGFGPTDSEIRNLTTLAGMLFLILTFFLLDRLIREFGFSRSTARWGALLAVLTTPWLIYATQLMLLAHFLSGFLTTVMLMSWLSWIRLPRYHLAWWGAFSLGLLAVTRWQNILLFTAVIPAIGYCVFTDRTRWRRRFLGLVSGIPFFVLPVLVQCRVWQIQFGDWFLMPQGSRFMHWTEPAILPLLFSGYHGILPWAPGIILGLIGLILMIHACKRPNRTITILSMFLTCLAVIYISACPDDWYAGSSYGPRRLSALLPFAALGMASILARLRTRGRVALIVMLMGWSLVTITAEMGKIEDLSTVILGRTDPHNPYPEQYENLDVQTERLRWKEGFTNLRVKGFSFPANYHWRDRIWGGIVITVMVLLLASLFRHLRKSSRLRQYLLWGSVAWVLIFLGVVMVLPDNQEWDPYWLQIHTGKAALRLDREMPRELASSGHVIQALRALKSNNLPRFYRHHAAFYPGTFPGLDMLTMLDLIHDPEFSHLVDGPIIIGQ